MCCSGNSVWGGESKQYVVYFDSGQSINLDSKEKIWLYEEIKLMKKKKENKKNVACQFYNDNRREA